MGEPASAAEPPDVDARTGTEGAASSPEDDEAPLPSWETFDYGGGFREVAIVKCIEEYLGYHYLGKSLAAFNRDVERVGLKHTPGRACLVAARDVEEVLADFDAGR